MITEGIRHRWLVCASILALSLVAQPFANAASVRRPHWGLEGFVGQAPAGIRPDAHLVLRYEGKDYEFDLTKAVVIAGRASRTLLLRDIEPGRNQLILRGSAKTMGALTNASVGQKLLIYGYLRTGSRDLQVTKIAPASPDSAPAAK